MARTRAIPVLISNGVRCPLEPAPLGDGLHDETWLQALIHDHPEILPIIDIEPGFGDLITMAREVPCRHGLIDNLFVTPSGDIVIVEAHLWRTTARRRKVMALPLDIVPAPGRKA